jgi:hypothetical protein
MLDPLRALRIGDEESRSLFASALEYDLAGLRKLTEPASQTARSTHPGSDSEQDAALAELTEAAQDLAQQLDGLDEDASRFLQHELSETDRFRRGYTEDYIESLRVELGRVAGIGDTSSDRATAAPSEQAISDDARRFIRGAAGVFRECFELNPNAESDSPFVLALVAIVAATGIRIPTDRPTLTRILDQG